MAYIKTDRVTVVYPIYNSRSQSLRHALIEVGTGGIVARGARNITTVTALDGVSLSLKDGDRVGLTGHNGSGKSTLLRLLAGVYAPTSGEIEMSGSISTIFQLGTGLDPELTGYENIERMGMFLGLRKAEARRFIPDIEEFTELGQFLSVPVRTYSAGMMTRLTFAVATAVKPSILLIDEVFSAGDASFQAKARKRMAEMIDSVKILVFASHSKGTSGPLLQPDHPARTRQGGRCPQNRAGKVRHRCRYAAADRRQRRARNPCRSRRSGENTRVVFAYRVA